MFTKSDDGIITFNDTSTITYDQFNTLMKHMNYIGYDFPDPDSVKSYFDRHTPLNKDQSDVVISVFNKENINYSIDENKQNRYIKKSIEKFGVTYDWKKAGYVLSNGLMLNFAGPNYTRVMDHRDINSIVENPKPIEHYSENNCAMIEFINYGHIRCQDCGFETATRLTPEQKQTIKRYMHTDDDIYIDIMNHNGHTVHSMVYDKFYPEKIFNDIDSYFDELAL